MSRRIQWKAGALGLPLTVLPLAVIRCSGTEADNPVTDVVVTHCKTEEEYDPGQIAEFLDQRQQTARASSVSKSASRIPKSTEPPGALQRPLSATADIPIGLFCVEWRLESSRLEVQIVNFDSNCGAEWQGRARLEGDRVTLELENSLCSVAACGTCLFDTATVIEVPAEADVTLALSLDPFCDGAPEVREWQLPLGTQPRGIDCGYARPPGLGGLQGPPFMGCGDPVGGACDAGLTCVDAGDEYGSHCLPACQSDTDCPLSGGTRCSEGFCRPASTVATG